MNFIRRLNRAIFIFQATVLLGGWKLTTNTKFQHNISKITPAGQKKTQGHGM